MSTIYLFELRGKGLCEPCPEATVYDTEHNRLGEATSHAYGGGAWAVRIAGFAGHMPFDSPAILYTSPDGDPPADYHESLLSQEDEDLCGCGGKGWAVFNEDPANAVLGKIQRCDECALLPDDETTYDAAAAAGLLVDAEGKVLAPPGGVYAAEARRQRRVSSLRRRLVRFGRLLGFCTPQIHFYVLGNHVFCDKSTAQVDYAGTLPEFERMIAESKLPGFRPI
ncbi:MAG TPA: hypothetical protein VF173_02865 [Thermoanaerobaculia bacterium]|nr:hypothetical protein [Thermoanaerobaculia bacterium]